MIRQMIKYGLVTLISYIYIIGGTYILVELYKVSASISYFIILTTNYLMVFFAGNYFIFKTEMKKETVFRYIIALVCFWIFNNLFFNLMIHIFKIKYIIAVIFNILFFGFIRFYIQRRYVFKKHI